MGSCKKTWCNRVKGPAKKRDTGGKAEVERQTIQKGQVARVWGQGEGRFQVQTYEERGIVFNGFRRSNPRNGGIWEKSKKKVFFTRGSENWNGEEPLAGNPRGRKVGQGQPG